MRHAGRDELLVVRVRLLLVQHYLLGHIYYLEHRVLLVVIYEKGTFYLNELVLRLRLLEVGDKNVRLNLDFVKLDQLVDAEISLDLL